MKKPKMEWRGNGLYVGNKLVGKIGGIERHIYSYFLDREYPHPFFEDIESAKKFTEDKIREWFADCGVEI